MTSYPFRAGIDYGPRHGTLGLGFHMSEGGDELVTYLARRSNETVAAWHTRIRNVSANAAILSDGTVWQMVPWANAAGSFNPADRNPATTGFYNGTVIRAVLGDHYVDPNTWSIVAEIAGRRDVGPTPAQVEAAIAWGRDMKARYPSLRGAFGHHDQTDTKGCPGTTPAMKAIFAGVGGHGLWTPEGGDMGEFVVPFAKPLPFAITGSAKSFDASPPYAELDAVSGATQAEAAVYVSQAAVPHGAFMRIVTGATGRRLVAAASGTLGGPVDCTPLVEAARRDAAAAAMTTTRTGDKSTVTAAIVAATDALRKAGLF